MHYRLDVETMLGSLQRRKVTGRLQAEIVRHPSLRTPAKAEIELLSGNVIRCFISSLTGEWGAEGSQARQMLARLGVLDWEWQEQVLAPPIPDVGAVVQRRSIPHRQREIPSSLVQRMSRSHLRALMLIDGKRNSTQIAALLRIPVKDVDDFFNELEKAGYIVWREE